MRKVAQAHGGSITLAEKGDVLSPGRPKKLVSTVTAELKAEGYENVTPAQVMDIIEVLLNLDKARVKQLAEDEKQPIYIQRTARRLYGASDKEIGEFIDKLLDRAHGKAKQGVDVTSGGKELQGQDAWFKALPLEDQIEILKIKNKHGAAGSGSGGG